MNRRRRIKLPSSSDSSSDVEDSQSSQSRKDRYSSIRVTQQRITRTSNCMLKGDAEARQQAKFDGYENESDEDFIYDGSDTDEKSEDSGGDSGSPVLSRSNSVASSISITSSEDEQEQTTSAIRNMVEETDSEDESAAQTNTPTDQSLNTAPKHLRAVDEELPLSTTHSNSLASHSAEQGKQLLLRGAETSISLKTENSQECTTPVKSESNTLVKHEKADVTSDLEGSETSVDSKELTTPSSFNCIKEDSTPHMSSANKRKVTPSSSSRRRSTQRRVLDSDDEDEDIKVIYGSEDQDSDIECVYNEKTTPSGRKRRKKNYNRIKILPDSQEAEDNNSAANEQEGENNSESTSSDEMSDFIVDDEQSISGVEDGSDSQIFYPKQKLHNYTGNLTKEQSFQVVLEGLLNRCVDPNFFTSEDYKEPNIRSAFRKIFSKVEMLTQDLRSSVWSSRFVSLLDFPNCSAFKSDMAGSITCEACNRRDRYVSHKMRFSGVKYDMETLQDKVTSDDDDDDDESSDSSDTSLRNSVSDTVHVGKYCMMRARAYHELLHFKRELLDECMEQIQMLKLVNDIETISKKVLANKNWIRLQYMHLNTISDQATKIIQKRSNITEDDYIK